MPYANNQGVRIYYETEGQGPPLVLAHGMGFGSDLNMWRATGYTDALKDNFRLVLFDIRGHGRSGKPGKAPSAKSNLSDPSGDVVSILDALGIAKAHFFGYSMGAGVGFKQAVAHPDRFYSFVLGGLTPGRWPAAMVEAMRISGELTRLRRTDPEAYFVQMEQLLKHALTPAERSDLLARDAGAGAEEPAPRNNEPALTEEQLSGISAPCLLFCGDEDPFHDGAQEAVQHMPRAVFVSMHGLNHITAISRSDVVAPLVKRFVGVVSNTPQS